MFHIIDLPTLHSFEDALAHFNKITPIRGSELRPLCRTTNGRRKKHVQIVHSLHPAGDPREAVACRLYNTDVVTFYAGGDIVINTGGYATPTTHSFINNILWRHVEARTQKGFTVISVCGDGPKAVLKAPESQITIRLQNGKVCFPDTRAGFTAYYLKRAQYLLRQREIAPFRKFARACAKMIDPKDYEHSRSRGRDIPAAARRTLHDFMLDQESWHAALELLIPACRRKWTIRLTGRGSKFCSSQRPIDFYSTYSAGPSRAEVNIKRLNALLDSTIKYRYAEELFEVREAKTPFVNDNYKYLGEGAL